MYKWDSPFLTKAQNFSANSYQQDVGLCIWFFPSLKPFLSGWKQKQSWEPIPVDVTHPSYPWTLYLIRSRREIKTKSKLCTLWETLSSCNHLDKFKCKNPTESERDMFGLPSKSYPTKASKHMAYTVIPHTGEGQEIHTDGHPRKTDIQKDSCPLTGTLPNNSLHRGMISLPAKVWIHTQSSLNQPSDSSKQWTEPTPPQFETQGSAS